MAEHSDPGRERRRYERMARDGRLAYERLAGGRLPFGPPENPGRLLDIGGGGLRCLIPEEVGKDEQMVVRLEFDGWREEDGDWRHTGDPADRGLLTVLARVMWCTAADTGYEVGLCFTGRVN